MINSPSTQTLEWGTAAPLVLPSCQPVRRVRKSWGCWEKPLTGDSSLPLGDLSPQVSTMSSPGMIFTTRPVWVVDHSGMHHIVPFGSAELFTALRENIWMHIHLLLQSSSPIVFISQGTSRLVIFFSKHSFLFLFFSCKTNPQSA